MRIRYQRTHKQREIEECRADFLGIVGGYGAGKTHVAANICIHEAVEYPGSRGLIVGHTYEQVELTVLRELYARLAFFKIRHEPATNSSREIRLGNRSIIRVKSVFADAESIKSTEVDWILGDEASLIDNRDDYELIVARARAKVGSCRVRFLSNSVPQAHWLAQDYHLRPLPDHKLINITTYDNRRFLRPGTIERYEARYKPGTAAWRRHLMGQVGIPNEGAVFEEFDVATDSISEITAPRVRRTLAALFIGEARPTACIVVGIPDDGPLLLIDEYYAETGTSDEHVAAIRAMYGGTILCDPAHKHDPKGEKFVAYMRKGLRLKPAHDNRTMGDDDIKRLLADDRLKIQRRKNGELAAPRASMQFETYMKPDRPPDSNSSASDEPVDANNETIHCLRLITQAMRRENPRGFQQMREAMFGMPLPM